MNFYPIFCLDCQQDWISKKIIEPCIYCGSKRTIGCERSEIVRQNPKLVGSNLIDCVPQEGPCPRNCNQCFYNRDKSLWKSHIPTWENTEGKIVRMNTLHDSNLYRLLVLTAADRYKHVFFNTAISNFNFPGPVVYTANSSEEQPVDLRFLRDDNAYKLMFIRLRVSSTNLHIIKRVVKQIFEYSEIPIVLTFMAYYDDDMSGAVYPSSIPHTAASQPAYVWKVRHVNEYWCPTRGFKKYVLDMMREIAGRQVTMCGTLDSNFCKDCRNCESYYWVTSRLMRELSNGRKDES